MTWFIAFVNPAIKKPITDFGQKITAIQRVYIYAHLSQSSSQLNLPIHGGCPSTKHCCSFPSSHPNSFTSFPHQHRAMSLNSHLLHSPLWHTLSQECFLQPSVLLQIFPQERSRLAIVSIPQRKARTFFKGQ